MNSRTNRLTDQDRLDLADFVQQASDPATTQQIQAKVANDPAVRAEVVALEESWKLLELLPRPPAKVDFMQRTSELITIDEATWKSAKESEQTVANSQPEPSAPSRRWSLPRLAGWWHWKTAVAAVFLLSFATSRWKPDPARAMLEDFPIVSRFDEYEAVGDIEFLKALEKSKLTDRMAVDEGSRSRGATP